jgi:hypothetical protein
MGMETDYLTTNSTKTPSSSSSFFKKKKEEEIKKREEDESLKSYSLFTKASRIQAMHTSNFSLSQGDAIMLCCLKQDRWNYLRTN